jgi:hypothetical protein
LEKKMLASRSVPFLAAMAACALVGAVMFAVSDYSSGPSELVQKPAVAAKSTKSALVKHILL